MADVIMRMVVKGRNKEEEEKQMQEAMKDVTRTLHN